MRGASVWCGFWGVVVVGISITYMALTIIIVPHAFLENNVILFNFYI